MRREDIKIKHCFWRTTNGKCVSPEIYRFQKIESDICPYDLEATAFIFSQIDSQSPLRCLEFRHKARVFDKVSK